MPRSRVRKAAKYGLKRPWAPARHRELILYLVGLGLVGTCVLVPTFHYWEYFRAERAFAVDAGRGKPALSEVEKLEDRGRSVLPVDTVHVYDEAFPTSGPYDPIWANPGFYSTSRSPTLLVHSLERGYVVIYYDNPAPDVLNTLRLWAGLFHEDRDGIIVVPYPGLNETIVLTAWQKRLRLSQFNPSAAAAFIDAFRGHGPERQVR
jgi:hypothetical protein